MTDIIYRDPPPRKNRRGELVRFLGSLEPNRWALYRESAYPNTRHVGVTAARMGISVEVALSKASTPGKYDVYFRVVTK